MSDQQQLDAVTLARFKIWMCGIISKNTYTRADDRKQASSSDCLNKSRLKSVLCSRSCYGYGCAYLIVDLMFTEMLLQLALSSKDLGAYCALLVLELSITEISRLTFICIWWEVRERTLQHLPYLIWFKGLSPGRNSWSRYDTVHFSHFNYTGAVYLLKLSKTKGLHSNSIFTYTPSYDSPLSGISK